MYCPICDQKPMNCDCTPEERRMHAEIEDLEEQVPRWIPVTERLPEIGQRTLVRCNGQTFVGTFCSVPYESGEGAHAYWDGDECDTYLNVTHWMPLPAPPTDDK